MRDRSPVLAVIEGLGSLSGLYGADALRITTDEEGLTLRLEDPDRYGALPGLADRGWRWCARREAWHLPLPQEPRGRLGRGDDALRAEHEQLRADMVGLEESLSRVSACVNEFLRAVGGAARPGRRRTGVERGARRATRRIELRLVEAVFERLSQHLDECIHIIRERLA